MLIHVTVDLFVCVWEILSEFFIFSNFYNFFLSVFVHFFVWICFYLVDSLSRKSSLN